MVCEGPGRTEKRGSGVQALDREWSAGLPWRQSWAVSVPGMLTPSVVLEGVVQWRWTESPMRWAARSVTTSGRCRDGGRGGPGLAQPTSRMTRGKRRVTAVAPRTLPVGR